VGDLPVWSGWLVELREGRGWSQADLAGALQRLARELPSDLGLQRVAAVSVQSIKRTIRRWETDGVQPDERYCVLLAHAYATRNGEATIGQGSEFELLVTAFAAMGVSVKRREYLCYLASAAATVAGGAFLSTFTPELRQRTERALMHPNQVDLGTLRGLRAAVSDLAQQSEGAMSYLRLVSAVTPHVLVVRHLLNGTQPDPVRQELCELAVQTFSLAGRLAFNLRDDLSARQFRADADVAAGELRDGWMKRWWLSSRARVARFNDKDLDSALFFAKKACEQSDRSSNVGQAWSFCVLAEMYSLNGDERKARKAIDLARLFARGDLDEDPAAHLFPESRFGGLDAVQARISAYEGTCCLRAEQLDQAEAALTAALDGIPAAIQGQRSFLLADLATVAIRREQPERACDLLRAAYGIAGRTGAVIPLQRIYRVRRELHPWRHERFVMSLDELLLPAALPL
jgi:transcriptional regulator with XRE-family HTH domain/tetratricopeptide (TPR) repeat protein